MTLLPHPESPRAFSSALSCHCAARSADTASSFLQSSCPREAVRVGKSARHRQEQLGCAQPGGPGAVLTPRWALRAQCCPDAPRTC